LQHVSRGQRKIDYNGTMSQHLPLLIILSGLPGVGKSTLARRLQTHYAPDPVVVLQSDRIRKQLFAPPTYSAAENAQVHDTIRQRIGTLLASGHIVIYDATNLTQAYRDRSLAVASIYPATTVEVVAPESTVRARLAQRQQDPLALSDATYEIYQQFSAIVEPVTTNSIRVRGVDGFSADFDRLITFLDAHRRNNLRGPK
jgi:predicted kinase